MLVAVMNARQTDRLGLIYVVADLQSYLQFVLLFQAKTSRIFWQLGLLCLGQMAIASTLVPGPTFGIFAILMLVVMVMAFAQLLLDVESRSVVAAPSLGGAVALRRRATLRGTSQQDDVETTIRRLTLYALGLAIATVVVSGGLFFLLPRWTVINREIAVTQPLQTVGFSKTVTLGELGEVVQNPDIVMRIQFFHGRSNRPFKLRNEPLLRGTTVTNYEGARWAQANSSAPVWLPIDHRSPFVRQRITAEPLDVAELFCIFPIFGLTSDGRLRIDPAGDQVFRQEDFRQQRIEFEVGTTGIVDERQHEFLPAEPYFFENQREELLQMPEPGENQPDRFVGLRALAAQVLADRGIDPADHVAAANALNDYLSRSGKFSYSLQGQQRDPQLDPIEDFVTLHRQGHCEYFSGALVMLLRSQGIPARMVIGFKGGEWNPLGMYYQVQQLHAHTWVEVYLDKRTMPQDAFVGYESQPDAAWLVLDPTEGTQEKSSDARRTGILAWARQSMDYGQVLWANYVVGLNARRQQQGIYEPLVQGLRAGVDNLFSAQVWQARMNWVAASPLGAFWQWYRRHWFDWRGGLVAATFSAFLIGCYLLVPRAVAAWRQWRAAVTGRSGQEPPLPEIYRRLEAVLARQGLVRQPSQTAYEFAVVAGGQLAERGEYRRLAALPRRVVEAFYRIRFGGHTLDNPEVEAVEQALAELELVLSRSQ